METIATIGLDLAKNVFQVHCVDGVGTVIIKRQLRRSEVLKFFTRVPTCLIGIEACGTAHYWGRELLKLGHNVKLMPPAYVKPYVKRGHAWRCAPPQVYSPGAKRRLHAGRDQAPARTRCRRRPRCRAKAGQDTSGRPGCKNRGVAGRAGVPQHARRGVCIRQDWTLSNPAFLRRLSVRRAASAGPHRHIDVWVGPVTGNRQDIV